MRLVVSAVAAFVGVAGVILSQLESAGTDQIVGGHANSIRVASVQPRSRIIDWRLSPQEVLREVDETIDQFVALVERAGDEGCDLIVFPEDTLGILH